MSLLVKPKLLILDEKGYLKLDSFAATCLFQFVSEWYEKGSIILTSNKSYGDRGSIFADNVIASAILDRLWHHSTTINIKSESYRLKNKKKVGLIAAKLPGKENLTPGHVRAGACGSGLRPPPHLPANTKPAFRLGNIQTPIRGEFS